jgi:hypothetical protein
MNYLLDHWIEALRDELKQYGEMLALLDEEQDLVMHRQTVDMPPCVAAINSQSDTLQTVRLVHEQRRRHLARTLGLNEDCSLRELISRLPAEYQPLVQALIQENKELLIRVQHRARQNHLLLSRMVELMQKLISSIVPGTVRQATTDGGLILPPTLLAPPRYDATG